jgi:hypothetical protein
MKFTAIDRVKDKVTSLDMELAVAKYFNTRVNLIVPNISWGLCIHEVDMLVVTPSNWCYEVEIKVSKSDLVADSRKPHGHKSKLIKLLYFAIPKAMDNCVDLIPDRAGVLSVDKSGSVWCLRKPEQNKEALKLTDAQRLAVARLGAMRIWTLKKNIRNLLWQ